MTAEEKEQFKAMQQAILEMSREIALLKYALLHGDSRPDGVPLSKKESKVKFK